jgi:hypothetical protein
MQDLWQGSNKFQLKKTQQKLLGIKYEIEFCPLHSNPAFSEKLAQF